MLCDYEVKALPVALIEQLWNEQQLMDPVKSPAWKLWNYESPMVILGCSQRRFLKELDKAFDTQILIRESGGGAVLAGPWMMGISVSLPINHHLVSGGPVDSYKWFGELIANVLNQLGVNGAYAISPAQLKADLNAGNFKPVSWACFGGRSPWEVLTADGKKIAGLAQVRRRNGVLLVAGILINPTPWGLLCSALEQDELDAVRLTNLTSSCSNQIKGNFDLMDLEQLIGDALHARLSSDL
ncbi:MAG: hypothetical protein RL212_1032 [Pseudomonadota bacterium]|jgi:lipoate-protein ligase A